MSETIKDSYRDAILLVQSNPLEAIQKLDAIQTDVSALALFSSNETIDDVATSSILLLSLDHHIAMAYVAIPTIVARERKVNLTSAVNYFSRFLESLSRLDVLSDARKKEFLELLQTNLEGDDRSTYRPTNREDKIQRFRYKTEIQQQLDQLQSVKSRRNRLGLRDDEDLDGYDEDSLERKLGLNTLLLHSVEAIEEWNQALREMSMIEMRIRMEEQRADGDPRHGVVGTSGGTNASFSSSSSELRSNHALKLTHITKDQYTGQLNIRKEEIRSQVFRPGWNQPTMSLEELGELEMRQAIIREENQKLAEEQQKNDPRRYDQLVKDGMEDNAELVDASAALDRKWDDWRAENPKGSGNKMGDRGDRNF